MSRIRATIVCLVFICIAANEVPARIFLDSRRTDLWTEFRPAVPEMLADLPDPAPPGIVFVWCGYVTGYPVDPAAPPYEKGFLDRHLWMKLKLDGYWALSEVKALWTEP
jgi:hypothetical protein